MKYYKLILASLPLLPVYTNSVFAIEEDIKESCEQLGYTTLYEDCRNAKGTPLLCPFYSTDNRMTACLKQSCRGYDLTNDDLDVTASDGQTYRAHAKSISSCTIGNGNDAIAYYRVDECKEGSRYQDGLCDVGCSVDRYPYTEHQGNLAGDMRSCVEASGERFGYYTCNDGWTGGWKNTGVGKCSLNKCAITEYPYPSDPNLEEYRGFTLSCKIGGNTYYKYSTVDKEGKTLTSDTCSSNGYTLNWGVCSKRCNIGNCSATVKSINQGGLSFQYNEWSCKVQTAKCRVGDYAYFNGVYAGIIAHMPDDDNKMYVMKPTTTGAAMAYGDAETTTIPNVPTYSHGGTLNDFNGKYNCKTALAFQASKNSSFFTYPLYTAVNNYAPSGCTGACGVGEWYVYAGGELFNIFVERYILYNVTKSSNFIGAELFNSTEWGGSLVNLMAFSGISWNGTMFSDSSKKYGHSVYPIISFTLK